jgi:hypothetical protein
VTSSSLLQSLADYFHNLSADLPEGRQEQINVRDLPDLIDKESNIGQELLRCMIVQYIHVDPLSPAIRESFLVVLLFDKRPDTRNNHCPWVDSLEITSGHLKDQTSGSWHCSDEAGSSFDTSTSLIFFWVV